MVTNLEESKVPGPAHGAQDSAYNAPDWEVPEASTTRRKGLRLGSTSRRWAVADRFDRVLPPYKRYIGLKRRAFLLAVAAVLLAIIALAVGLGVGLGKKHNNTGIYKCLLVAFTWSLRGNFKETVSYIERTARRMNHIDCPEPNTIKSAGGSVNKQNIGFNKMTQGSTITPLQDISPKFKEAELKRAARQQERHTPDYLKEHTQNRSRRRSEALCSSPPMSPMVDDPSLSGKQRFGRASNPGEYGPRFNEYSDRSHAAGVYENHPTEVHEVPDHMASFGTLHHRRFIDVGLSDEKTAPAPGEHLDHHNDRNLPPIPPPVLPEPRTTWTPQAQHHPYLHDTPYRASKPNLSPSFLHNTFSKIRGDPKTTFLYLVLVILSTFLIYAIVYAIIRLLPLYDNLRDLKDKLASIDAFKDKVAAKLGAWLDDGKDLAKNVKDQAKIYADTVVDEANKVLGKFGKKLDHCGEFGRSDDDSGAVSVFNRVTEHLITELIKDTRGVEV
ncbi:uncharacterized protein N0V89_000481 [Didymosphaeria variabile]|uniref:Uncharacterized protein n=1 Tax=Didymosphaeria variabile TaxID=1932322 RepID=A0A9W8XWV7_9PLEO|nr:uncharacterized protein N0V89_000481 [Didymosphaeria variabile]KAJ4359922.1 hypothetical protein N0V89_000481 [Didymosphaeria variabile]